MPTYEFFCHRCSKPFEVTCSIAEYGRKIKAVKCTKCGSSKVVRRISAFQVQTAKKS
ncbi:MAG: zinc ribbon domain-containing protein [Deltaproteobacteria bacterium]|nr:zinc ribbon domain-containing protein [Deltaproteobacteria bacterium]